MCTTLYFYTFYCYLVEGELIAFYICIHIYLFPYKMLPFAFCGFILNNLDKSVIIFHKLL